MIRLEDCSRQSIGMGLSAKDWMEIKMKLEGQRKISSLSR